MKASGKDYDINEGDGAFYGPKIDFKLTDALKRSWQCATIQCDFTLPERFELSYIDRDGEPKRPVMLHRVILGSIERFIGVLTEHYAGAFPLWLAPEQVRVLTVTERADEWAREITQALVDADIGRGGPAQRKAGRQGSRGPDDEGPLHGDLGRPRGPGAAAHPPAEKRQEPSAQTSGGVHKPA